MQEINKDLLRLRDRIDYFDKEILKLLYERFTTTRAIGIIKKNDNIDSVDDKRFNEIIENIMSMGIQINLDPTFLKNLFTTIHNQVIKEHNSL